MRPVYRRLLQHSTPTARVILVTAATSYLVALVWSALDSIVDIRLVRAMLDSSAQITRVSQLFGGALYNAFTLMAWSVLYVAVKQQRALHEERERLLRAEAAAQSARLESLRLQLNPHFLFNSLNAISTLVIDNRPADASNAIASLADILRASLARGQADEHSLRDELNLVERYLSIERLRLGDRLRVQVDVTPDALEARVPSLVLQPIVENAVRHAVASRIDGGTISIVGRRDGPHLVVEVADDGAAAVSFTHSSSRPESPAARERR